MDAVSQYLPALKRVPLFAGLPDRDLATIARQVTVRDYRPESVIVQQGNTGLGFYLIAEGEVEVVQDGQVRRTLGPGAFFGELALIEDAPRSASVVARMPTRCLVLVSWDFRALLKQHPEMTLRLLEEIVHRLHPHTADPTTA